jgi:REP element-mobilizing transposase RayT
MSDKFVRKANRLSFKQVYNSNNYFFVTMCVQDRACIFVEETPTFPFLIKDIIQNEWLNIAKFYSNVILDEFVIMPNYFDGIIGFNGIPVANINQQKYQSFKNNFLI